MIHQFIIKSYFSRLFIICPNLINIFLLFTETGQFKNVNPHKALC